MSNLIEALNWRYATKKFDTSKTVSDADISTLKQAVNLTASSFGLQPYRVLIVTDQETKSKLRAAAYDQGQVSDASHVFVFASKLDVTPEYVDEFIKLTAETRDIPVETIEGYGEYIKGSIADKDETFILNWNKRQAYIGLGSLLAAAGELRVDSCPMEGFDPGKFDEILGLKEKGLTATVIAPVGYRHADDHAAQYAKVRLPLSDMFI